jgi:hypothetical protein
MMAEIIVTAVIVIISIAFGFALGASRNSNDEE